MSGHNLHGQEKTDAHRAAIAAGARRAWSEKRTRVPLGSKRHNPNGYVIVKTVVGEGRWTPEHQLVAQKMLGRPLRPGEAVHHVNGVRDDNCPENLYVCRNNRHHMQVEHSMAIAFRELLAAGLATFNRETGRYEPLLLGSAGPALPG